ncbi:50S ribosomal protein L24 [Candidatus Woesearchaeota archaeon]|nr:50S ribosomal protein L24 [Candidatus Woesearchaeota archaeon]
MKAFSRKWLGSKKPGKQRKYRSGASLHRKQKLLNTHLAKVLREKYNARAVILRKGDKVKIMRGQWQKKEGTVDDVMVKKGKVIVQGIERAKKDGSKIPVLLDPSNLLIIELITDDKKRIGSLERKGK